MSIGREQLRAVASFEMYCWRGNHFAAFSICIYVTFLTNSTLSAEEPLYCFQCKSSEDPDCQSLFNASMYYKPCPAPTSRQEHYKPFCRKIVQKIHTRGGLEVVVRRCGWIRHPTQDCYTGRNIDRSQKVCQCFTHGCNSSPNQSTTVAALLICAGVMSTLI